LRQRSVADCSDPPRSWKNNLHGLLAGFPLPASAPFIALGTCQFSPFSDMNTPRALTPLFPPHRASCCSSSGRRARRSNPQAARVAEAVVRTTIGSTISFCGEDLPPAWRICPANCVLRRMVIAQARAALHVRCERRPQVRRAACAGNDEPGSSGFSSSYQRKLE
jgi:hypothetical protein